MLCEWNELDAALAHIKQGLALLPLWGKADDLTLAYITLARIHLAQVNKSAAIEAVEKATQIIQTSGLFPEAPRAVELAQVKTVAGSRRFTGSDPLGCIPAAALWLRRSVYV